MVSNRYVSNINYLLRLASINCNNITYSTTNTNRTGYPALASHYKYQPHKYHITWCIQFHVIRGILTRFARCACTSICITGGKRSLKAWFLFEFGGEIVFEYCFCDICAHVSQQRATNHMNWLKFPSIVYLFLTFPSLVFLIL